MSVERWGLGILICYQLNLFVSVFLYLFANYFIHFSIWHAVDRLCATTTVWESVDQRLSVDTDTYTQEAKSPPLQISLCLRSWWVEEMRKWGPGGRRKAWEQSNEVTQITTSYFRRIRTQQLRSARGYVTFETISWDVGMQAFVSTISNQGLKWNHEEHKVSWRRWWGLTLSSINNLAVRCVCNLWFNELNISQNHNVVYLFICILFKCLTYSTVRRRVAHTDA